MSIHYAKNKNVESFRYCVDMKGQSHLPFHHHRFYHLLTRHPEVSPQEKSKWIKSLY